MTPDDAERLQIGKPALSARGYNCCGKPQGCTNMNPGCAYLQHPYKRWIRGEITTDEMNATLARGSADRQIDRQDAIRAGWIPATPADS